VSGSAPGPPEKFRPLGFIVRSKAFSQIDPDA
jgi:hypothetical protein